MKYTSAAEVRSKMNRYSIAGLPFLFVVDFKANEGLCLRKEEINASEICYNINGIANYKKRGSSEDAAIAIKNAVSFQNYKRAFNQVQNHLVRGNTYLLNLTFETEIQITGNMLGIFYQANAPYKLYIKDQFICFSPESFVKIEGNRITTYPMKGTRVAVDEDSLIEDHKEFSEQATIVDLMRNDLSRVADEVELKKFRYSDRVNTPRGSMWMTSSEVSGKLKTPQKDGVGDIIFELLPPGSVTGAPKAKTMAIIEEVEEHQRGFYTGVFGFYDGFGLKSAVMIRFIEKTDTGYFFKSGGGITAKSEVVQEYREMLDKIVIPQ